MSYLNHSKTKDDYTKKQCENCRVYKPKEFGKYVPFNNGLNQKWVCKECYEKRNHR